MKRNFGYLDFVKVRAPLGYYSLQALVVLLIAFIAFRLYGYDLKVPFNYEGDTIQMLLYIKSLVQNGWTFEIPQLSAPFTMSAAAFPVATSTDWLLMKAISLFTSEVGLILNLFWLFTLVLSAWAATFSMRLLGVGRWLALMGGVLFAFLPFALMRNVAHLSLVYYAVPLLSLLTVRIALPQALDAKQDKKILGAGYLGCVVQGFNYIYFSFFAVLLFVFAALINRKSKSAIRIALIAGVIVVASVTINLSPSFYSWHVNGEPPGMDYKNVAEAERYGTKLRKMLAPHPENPIGLLATWGKKDIAAKFPNENENITARLGLYGASGLLLLLAISLRVFNAGGTLLPTLANISLFTVLVITVGGFGAIFNLLTVPDIRCYNRFSVFLGFFSITAVSAWIQSQIIQASTELRKRALMVCITVFAIFSLYDQLLDSGGLRARQKTDILQARQVQELVSKIEGLSTGDLKIFQFPITVYPLDAGLNKMGVYEHGKPYLWSSHLSWSWPSFSQRHRVWQNIIPTLKDGALVKYLALSGFDLVWVDRYGYKDNGTELVKMLIYVGAKEQLAGSSDRYAILNLRDYKKQLVKSIGQTRFDAESFAVLNAVQVEWKGGFYEQEINPEGTPFRWSKDHSNLVFRNFSDHKKKVELSFDLASESTGQVYVTAGERQWVLNTESRPTHHHLEFELTPKSGLSVQFSTQIARVHAPRDPREMFFYLANPVINDLMRN